MVVLADEKKQYDPQGFRDAILEGLEAAGDDLEAVSKFLDVSGGKQDYRRYGVNLVEILVAGGLLGKAAPTLCPNGNGGCVTSFHNFGSPQCCDMSPIWFFDPTDKVPFHYSV